MFTKLIWLLLALNLISSLTLAAQFCPEISDHAEDKIQAVLERKGFTVERGVVEKLTYALNCSIYDPTYPCMGANNTPFVAARFKKWGGLIEDYDIQVGMDDSLILFGCSPPPARYYGLNNFLSFRFEEGIPYSIYGTLTEPLNNLEINTNTGDPFNSPFSVIFSPDQDVESELMNFMDKTKFAPNALPFASSMNATNNKCTVNYGYDEELHDNFILYWRVAYPEGEGEEGSDFEKWIKDVPMHVFKLTRTNSEPNPQPQSVWPARTNQENDLMYQSLLEILKTRLEEGIETRYENAKVVSDNLHHPWYSTGAECLCGHDDYINCGFDSTDATWRDQGGGGPLLTEDDFIIFAGVNHNKLELCEYMNIQFGSLTSEGMSIVDSDFEGSASSLIGDLPGHQNMFVFRIARNCDDDDFLVCIDMDEDLFPVGSYGYGIERTYLNPTTLAGNPYDNLVQSVIYRVEFPPEVYHDTGERPGINIKITMVVGLIFGAVALGICVRRRRKKYASV